MSWEQNLQDASFRGTRFDVLRTSDGRQRAIARHEYPYLDGADLEDLGARERRFSLTAVFWGDDYDTRLQAFIKVMDQAGNGELIHPIYGSIKQVQLETYQIKHAAENVDYCEIDLHFSEATTGNPFFVKQLASQQAGSVSTSATSAQSSGFASFASKISSIVSTIQGAAARVDALRNVMNYTMATLQGQVQGLVGSALDVITFPLSFTSSVTSFVSAMADIPQFAVGSIMSDWKNFSGQMNDVAGLAAGVNDGTAITTGATGLVSTGMTSGVGTSSGAPVSPTSIVAVGANPADVQYVTAAMQLVVATQLASTAAGILADESDNPTLSTSDIEQIVNDTRTSINTAISQYRSLYDLTTSRPVTEPLKDMALALQTASISVMNQLPALTMRTVNAPGNLTLIAFGWYGDYTRAGELLRLNPSIRNPNFVLPGTVLNAYVS